MLQYLLTTDSQNTDYNDLDGDGYFGGIGGDCDDNNWSVNPGAIETLDGVDNDCDGLVDYEDDNAVYCGNGIVDTVIGETCDDGNDNPTDGCNNCSAEFFTQLYSWTVYNSNVGWLWGWLAK